LGLSSPRPFFPLSPSCAREFLPVHLFLRTKVVLTLPFWWKLPSDDSPPSPPLFERASTFSRRILLTSFPLMGLFFQFSDEVVFAVLEPPSFFFVKNLLSPHPLSPPSFWRNLQVTWEFLPLFFVLAHFLPAGESLPRADRLPSGRPREGHHYENDTLFLLLTFLLVVFSFFFHPSILRSQTVSFFG